MDQLEFADRHNTHSLKWDRYKKTDVLPMWVADMDIKSPSAVIKAMIDRAAHGIYGYTLPPEELTEVICQRLQKRYQWNTQPDWLVWLPGLVCGLNAVCASVGSSDDAVLTSIPIYPPFLSAPQNMKRKLCTFAMTQEHNRYHFDLEAMQKAIDQRTRLYLHCHPHNPLGRSFDHSELLEVADLCLKNNLIICSDEIHCDLVLNETSQHIPMASISPEISDRTITLMAPSKTFNLPGLGFSFAVISNPKLRMQFKQAIEGIVPHPNYFSYHAALAAYKYGDSWLKALLKYLKENAQLVYQHVNQIPGLSMTKVEATYLAWIDTRESDLGNPQVFFENAQVGLSDGRYFRGEGYVRLNFGCKRTTLELALSRMSKAIQLLKI